MGHEKFGTSQRFRWRLRNSTERRPPDSARAPLNIVLEQWKQISLFFAPSECNHAPWVVAVELDCHVVIQVRSWSDCQIKTAGENRSGICFARRRIVRGGMGLRGRMRGSSAWLTEESELS